MLKTTALLTVLLQLLMRCAIAIDKRNLPEAQAIMATIFPMVSKHGTAEQRLGFYFLEGLAARIVGTGSAIYKVSASIHKVLSCCPLRWLPAVAPLAPFCFSNHQAAAAAPLAAFWFLK